MSRLRVRFFNIGKIFDDRRHLVERIWLKKVIQLSINLFTVGICLLLTLPPIADRKKNFLT